MGQPMPGAAARGAVTVAQRRFGARAGGRKGLPAMVTHRRQSKRDLPKAETLTAADLPRLERLAKRNTERNKRKLGVNVQDSSDSMGVTAGK